MTGPPARCRILAFVALLTLLGGCSTAYVQGASAYRQGRYDEAADQFAAALAEDPDRVDALVGLGLSRYRQGAWDEAIEALGRVAAREPGYAIARLYLALAYLQRGDAARAEEHLLAYRELRPDPRMTALVNRALRLLRSGPLTDEQRGFVAASLETAAAWQREVYEARQALREAELRRLSDERIFYGIPRTR
jgi:tetratricopeptide (TPR) repeat protein